MKTSIPPLAALLLARMFGSDWPDCLLRSSHAGWTGVRRGLTEVVSSGEQSAFWGGNAARIHGFEG